MSDFESTPENGVNTSAASPAPAQQEIQIPKYRLDEEIQKRASLAQENETLKALLMQAVPARTQRAEPPPESPRMQKLKEEDPDLYKELKANELRAKRLSADNFTTKEMLDRQQFIHYVGQDEANRLGPLIEKKLEEARRQNIFTLNRIDLYRYTIGEEAIQERRKPRAPATQTKAGQQQAQPTRAVQESFDAPSSDPDSQGIPTGGAAPAGKSAEASLEELERRLLNQSF